MALLPPFHLATWIEEHRHLLKPPVGNKKVYEDTEFIVMVVGGPNARKDYHLNEGEELFYQLEGEMVLKVVDQGEFKDIPIRAGEMFLLPGNVPHSPQRMAGSIGLVIERKRREGEQDGLRWYCDNCGHTLHETRFPLVDIVSQLREAIEGFYGNETLRTCDACGTVMPVPVQGGASTASPTQD